MAAPYRLGIFDKLPRVTLAPEAQVVGRVGARRLAGIAGLGYVAGVAIENMEILDAPLLGSSVADVRAYLSDEAFAWITLAAGAVALLFYGLFAFALFRLLRLAGGWSRALLVGGIGGPLVAVAGLVAVGSLLAAGSPSDDDVEGLVDFWLRARMVSGVFVALFLGGVGVAALRTRALPGWLARYAAALAVPMALAPIAAFAGSAGLEVAVRLAFALQTLWIFFTSLWLCFADGSGVASFVRRSAFLLLVLAAGLIGLALLAVPGSTGEFFAWGLGPEALAAFAGGVYVGSATVYAVGLGGTAREVRGLVAGAAVLSVSVFVITLGHLDQFDFDRLQAWAWVFLFAGFSLVMVGLLVIEHPPDGPAPPLAGWVRAVLAAVCILLGALGLALWIDPTALSAPFDLPPLGGRFAGSWVMLVAVLAGWAALRNRADEARFSMLALVTLPGGALVAALRTLPDLDSPSPYIAGLLVLIGLGVVLLRARPG